MIRQFGEKHIKIHIIFDCMSRSSPSRSDRKADDADVSYEIATPFQGSNAAIHLFARDDDLVEVLIAHIPEPHHYYNNYNSDSRDFLDQHAVGRWILDDVGSELQNWDYRTSSYKTNNPNYHLRDVYFECDRSEVNEAVLSAKRFLTKLEEKVVKQKQGRKSELSNSPQKDLSK